MCCRCLSGVHNQRYALLQRLPSGAANPTRPQGFQEIANKNLGYMQTRHQLLQKWV